MFKLHSCIIKIFLTCIFLITNCAAESSEVLQQYFTAVKSHQVNNIVSLFDANAKIITATGEIKGLANIRHFYLNGVLKCKNLSPKPGPYFIASNAIAVEIAIQCDGIEKQVGDFFTIQKGKIVSMRVYSGKHYEPAMC